MSCRPHAALSQTSWNTYKPVIVVIGSVQTSKPVAHAQSRTLRVGLWADADRRWTYGFCRHDTQAGAGGHGTGVFLPSHGAVGDPLPGGAYPPSMPGAGLPPTGLHAAVCGASQRSDETHSARTDSPPSGEQAAQQHSVRASHAPRRVLTVAHDRTCRAHLPCITATGVVYERAGCGDRQPGCQSRLENNANLTGCVSCQGSSPANQGAFLQAAAGSPHNGDFLATVSAANVVPSSALSSPTDVPPSLQQKQQQQNASDAGVSPASVSPDGTPQQNELLYGTRSAGLPLGKVRADVGDVTDV